MTKRIIAIVAAIALVCAFPFLSACKSPEEIESERTVPQQTQDIILNVPVAGEDIITVNGTGEVKAEPDIATVTFAVRTEDEDAETAQLQNSELMEAVLAVVKANGVQDADIETGYVQFNERYNYEKNPPVVTGYEMNNSITVTVRDMSTLGKLMSEAIAAGATDAGDVRFSLSDTDEEYGNALNAAVEDAYQKALAIAEAAGCTIEAVPVSIVENSRSETPNIYRGEMPAAEPMADAASEVSISTGELEITADVTVVYRIVTAG